MKKFISAADSFKVLHLKGSYFEMGIQYGQQLKEEIAFAIENCVHMWGIKKQNWRKETIYEFALKASQRAPSRIKKELEGMALGSGISIRDILAWNYIDDYWEVCQCSAFAAKGGLTFDGKMIVGRNNDYEDDLSNEIALTIVREPSSGNATLCNTWAGTIGTYEGINDKGLVVTTQFSQTFDRNEAGLSVKHKNLLLLEKCSSVEQVIDILLKDPVNFGCNILVADSETSAVIECSSSGCTIRLEEEERSISTNHYVKHVCYSPQDTALYLTRERFQYLNDQLDLHKGKLVLSKVVEMLTTGLVSKKGPDEYTTRCAIYMPESKDVYVAHGLLPASEGEFLKLNLDELLHNRKLLTHIPFTSKKADLENIKAPASFQELNWDIKKTQSIGNCVFDTWIEYLNALPHLSLPNLSSATTVKESLTFDIPEKGLAEEELVEYSKKLFFNHTTHVGYPGFLAYIMGAGTLPGVIADFIASAMNQNVGAWNLGPAAAEIETKLFQWFAQLFGLPESALGLTMAGGALANFTALKVARDQIGRMQLHHKDLANVAPLILYCSDRSHVNIDRAADMLGLGIDAVRKIETDENFKIKMDKLVEAIEEDRDAGNQPFAVVGTAGTFFGSIDPLFEMANICKKYNLWFHVDGAYGSMAILSKLTEDLFKGIELADSITFDPHKWLYISQSTSCVLFRDMSQAKASFVIDDDYVYEDKERTGIDFSHYGPQWSRGFSALKIWFSLIVHGKKAYSEGISQDILLARYFAEIVQAHPDFELTTTPNLSICCFRYKPQKISNSSSEEQRELYLNEVNKKLLTAIQLNGRFFLSSTNLNGKFMLRICIINFRNKTSHLLNFLHLLSTIGHELDQSQMENKSKQHKTILSYG